ncbi:uncharacterized protein LOC124262353 [Haliotis rubra]|uniref:uncharacterized protein LOC124262353 n=1 Tax=Haliotis rubra TaxID=36100 RepID=UPI001EE5784B|nr:uncharacterized protein LOC124262353 [Haliotis rubra]
MFTTDRMSPCVRMLLLLASLTTAMSQDSPVTMCLKDDDRNRTLNVTLTCPPKTIIAVGKSFFGQNQWGLCTLTRDDCTENILSMNVCDGKRNCSISFPGTYTTKCGFATFLRVAYDCVVGPINTPPHVEQRTPDPPQQKRPLTPPPTHPRRVASSDPVVTPQNNDDTALIAVCAVAVVITLLVLTFAIYLVIRRLLGVHQDVHSPGLIKSNGISGLFYGQFGCIFSRCHEQDPEDGGEGLGAPPAEQDDDDESRVAPVGAAAVEEVYELGRPDMTSDSPNQTDVTGQNPTEGNSARGSHGTEVHSEMSPRGSRVVGVGAAATSGDGVSAARGMDTSHVRLDAVAVPNTELSTLC